MLTEAEKDKIKLQEVYRQEVQKALEKGKTSGGKKVLSFLNTNFGLFLLSTVFISVFSWSYNKFDFIVKERRETQKTIKKLKVEIANRFFCIRKIGDNYPGEERAFIRTAIFGLNGGNYNSLSPVPAYSPIYLEFKERSFLSLLVEYKELIKDIPTQKIDSAIQFANRVPRYYWSASLFEKGSVSYYYLSDSVHALFLSDFQANSKLQ